MEATREQFVELAGQFGSDCWNPGHIVRQALRRYPDAQRVRATVTTGLWADVDVILPSGSVETLRVFQC